MTKTKSVKRVLLVSLAMLLWASLIVFANNTEQDEYDYEIKTLHCCVIEYGELYAFLELQHEVDVRFFNSFEEHEVYTAALNAQKAVLDLMRSGLFTSSTKRDKCDGCDKCDGIDVKFFNSFEEHEAYITASGLGTDPLDDVEVMPSFVIDHSPWCPGGEIIPTQSLFMRHLVYLTTINEQRWYECVSYSYRFFMMCTGCGVSVPVGIGLVPGCGRRINTWI